MKLELRNISCSYGRKQVLENITFSIPSCKSLTLLGPSGGGKSTLLRVIAGLIIPDLGEIFLNDTLIPSQESGLLAYRRSIGTVFQSWNLFPHLTVLENVSLPLHRVHGLSLKEAKECAMKLLLRFGLEEQARSHPLELSGGQSQRVAIIRAVAIHPKLLLFDEPTSALDPVMTSEVLDLIAELKKEGIDFILVSHHLLFTQKISDYIAFISNGQVIEIAPTAQFFADPQHQETRLFLEKVLKY